MNLTRLPYRNPASWILGSPLAPYFDAFEDYLSKGRYASKTVSDYIGSIAHFGRWLIMRQLDIQLFDEEMVGDFLNGHLPKCKCAIPVIRDRHILRAALGHLLVVLRANAVIAAAPLGTTPVDIELRHFDEHMSHVRGLVPKTCGHYQQIVGRLLFGQFANRPVDIPAITPYDVRQFIAGQRELYGTPSSVRTLASALNCYFRYRTSCGNQVHHLSGVVTYPANWQLASLPKALSGDEVKRLLGVLGDRSRSSRRDDAIVRCALDLGLRVGEVATLGLGDIDWRAGTVTLRRTKSHREDVLPLPDATGRAIADYLKFERPDTTNRAVFVRRIAPRDQPIGPDLVRKSIRQAYARAGLPYTRAHFLRHTMASRLLDGGSSLKEVADVLRHRSLNTTLIYAKLDSRNLREVALPWPGSAS